MRIVKPAGWSQARTAAAMALLALLGACASDGYGASQIYEAAGGNSEAVEAEGEDAGSLPEVDAEASAMAEPEPPAAAPSTITVDGQAFVYVTVTSATASAYHWILDTRWEVIGTTDTERQAAVLGSLVFGPEGVGDRVPLRREARYRFIPVCAGRPRWDLAQARSFAAPGTLELRCQ